MECVLNEHATNVPDHLGPRPAGYLHMTRMQRVRRPGCGGGLSGAAHNG